VQLSFEAATETIVTWRTSVDSVEGVQQGLRIISVTSV